MASEQVGDSKAGSSENRDTSSAAADADPARYAGHVVTHMLPFPYLLLLGVRPAFVLLLGTLFLCLCNWRLRVW